jgi:hypothetical protein
MSANKHSKLVRLRALNQWLLKLHRCFQFGSTAVRRAAWRGGVVARMDVAMNNPRTPVHEAAPAMAELYKLLLKSEKFVNWKPAADEDKPPSISALEQSNIMADKYYSPSELAKLWDVDVETVRNIFRAEPGVLKISNGSKLRTTLRIPSDVVERVHRRLAA